MAPAAKTEQPAANVTTTPKYSMTSTWESVTKVMRATTGLVGTATEVGMMRTREREGESERDDDERAHD